MLRVRLNLQELVLCALTCATSNLSVPTRVIVVAVAADDVIEFSTAAGSANVIARAIAMALAFFMSYVRSDMYLAGQGSAAMGSPLDAAAASMNASERIVTT